MNWQNYPYHFEGLEKHLERILQKKAELDQLRPIPSYAVKSIKVLNQGYNYVKKEWDSAEGKAKFIGSETEARLKVSFFGPFYGGYNVVDIDENYKNALIYGNSTEYMWILSRNKTIDEATKKRFIEKAKKDGFDVSKLIWVNHNKD